MELDEIKSEEVGLLKILVAPDSFKGSLSAMEVCNNIEIGIRKVGQDIDIIKVPMADGGEGTLEALIPSTNGDIYEKTAKDPLFRDISGKYGILGDGRTCIIEMARVSGLLLLRKEERNPMNTTTYGTGQLILEGLNQGCRNFIIGIGGSATTDGGIGMAAALGVKFMDGNQEELPPIGSSLLKIKSIDIFNMDERIKESTFTIASDVDNPLYGEEGAAYVYGPQKGADEEMVIKLDEGLRNYSNIIKKDLGKNIGAVKGAGAAGGLGAGLVVFLNAKMKSGVDIVIESTKLEEKMKSIDLVITGEGSIDFQTQFGKTSYGVAKLAKKYKKPVIGICGSLGQGVEVLYDHGFTSIFSIGDKPMTLEESMERTPELLQKTIENITRLWISLLLKWWVPIN